MKRLFSLVLIMCMIVSFASCNFVAATNPDSTEETEISESEDITEPDLFEETTESIAPTEETTEETSEETSESEIPAEKIPVVIYRDNKLYIDDEFITQTSSLKVNRIDSKIVSLTTDSGVFTRTADGKDIENLSDVIIDRDFYEENIGTLVNWQLSMLSTDFYWKYMDIDAMLEVVGSYDEAMKLDFRIHGYGVDIIYPFVAEYEDGTTQDASYSVSIFYEAYADMFNPDYMPPEGVKASPWMTGSLKSYPSDVSKDQYPDSSVLNSLKLENYKEEDYYWLCIRYESAAKSSGDTIYCSVVCTRDEKGETTVLYSRLVGKPFVCCNVERLEEIIDGLE